jgi:hypothetical protein
LLDKVAWRKHIKNNDEILDFKDLFYKK